MKIKKDVPPRRLLSPFLRPFLPTFPNNGVGSSLLRGWWTFALAEHYRALLARNFNFKNKISHGKLGVPNPNLRSDEQMLHTKLLGGNLYGLGRGPHLRLKNFLEKKTMGAEGSKPQEPSAQAQVDPATLRVYPWQNLNLDPEGTNQALRNRYIIVLQILTHLHCH